MVVRSPYRRTTLAEETKNLTVLKSRFKNLQGEIRNIVFDKLRELEAQGEKIDIVLYPDSDEIFSSNLMNLLETFWNSKYKAIMCKAVDVFGNFTTIHNNGMTGHLRIMKWDNAISAIPYRWQCTYLPMRGEERMKDNYTLIHLSMLNKEIMEWKSVYWGNRMNVIKNWQLWRTGEDVRVMSPKDLAVILSKSADTIVSEYLESGSKRMPCGTDNIKKALVEAHKYLVSVGVRHYLAFGTALGIHRDGEPPKWDWDVDLICDAEDLSKIKASDVYELGFDSFKSKKDIPKWIKGNEKSDDWYVRTISFMKYGCRIDIDPAYLSADGEYRIILKGRKREQFCAMHPRAWFENCDTVEYADNQFLLPTPIDSYLKSNYGEDWNTPKNCVTKWHKRSCMRENYECA
jgi:hypothetical protein